MDLSNLKPSEGSIKKRIRVGRGVGSGKGRTSTRGHNGAKSRSGYKTKPAFEGGQMPLQRRVPKFGFKYFKRKEYNSLNVDFLQHFANKYSLSSIDPEVLRNKKVISKNDKVKILGDGELEVQLNVSAHAFSRGAKEKIEAKNGTATVIS